MSKSTFTIVTSIPTILMLFWSTSIHAQDNAVFVGSSVEFMPQFYSDEVVKNAPVTARIKTKSVQKLYDGNRIVHEEVTDLYRDSRGRVRRENSSGGAIGERMISLSDPVEHHTFMLDTTNKIAFKVPEIGDLIGFRDGFHMSDETIDILVGGGVASVADQIVISESMDSVLAPGSGVVDISQGIGRLDVSALEMSDSAMLAASGPAWSGSGQTEVQPLGQKKMDGVRLEGTSYTTTYPPNSFGNEKSVVVKKTTWFAPELRMMVRSEQEDPRFGTVTFESEILSTEEPDASLFDIPSDYKLIEPGTVTASPP